MADLCSFFAVRTFFILVFWSLGKKIIERENFKDFERFFVFLWHSIHSTFSLQIFLRNKMEGLLAYVNNLRAAKSLSDLEGKGYTVSPNFEGWVVIGHIHSKNNKRDEYVLKTTGVEQSVSCWFEDPKQLKHRKHITRMCCGNKCQRNPNTFMVMLHLRHKGLKKVRLYSLACWPYYQDVYNWWVFKNVPGTHSYWMNGKLVPGLWDFWEQQMDKLGSKKQLSV